MLDLNPLSYVIIVSMSLITSSVSNLTFFSTRHESVTLIFVNLHSSECGVARSLSLSFCAYHTYSSLGRCLVIITLAT